MKNKEILPAVVFAIFTSIIIYAGIMFISSSSNTASEKAKKMAQQAQVEKVLEKMRPPVRTSTSMGWTLVCIEGYEYITRTTSYNGYIAPKFNELGRPSHCNEDDY